MIFNKITRVTCEHKMDIKQEYFDRIMCDLWINLPNGKFYTALANGELAKYMHKESASDDCLGRLSRAYAKNLLSLLELKEVNKENLDYIDDIYIDDEIEYITELVMTIIALQHNRLNDSELMVTIIALQHNRTNDSLCKVLGEKIEDRIRKCSKPQHYRALREISDLLFLFYGLEGNENPEKQGYYRKLCTAVTTENMTHWPNLVGAAVVRYGNWLLSQGDADEADKMYQNVILDLEYLIDSIDDPALPQAEKMIALWWLREAYRRKLKLHPQDKSLDEKYELVHQLLLDRDSADIALQPRIGRIFNIYKSEEEYLALIVKDITTMTDFGDKGKREIVHKYGVTTNDVEFYLSAIGSYSARDMLNSSGVKTIYDEDHEKVFAAIRLLNS